MSIQSLVLVAEPYFNEPGYEVIRLAPHGKSLSDGYNISVGQQTVRWAMLEMIRRPPVYFGPAVRKHFYMKRQQIKNQCDQLVKEAQTVFICLKDLTKQLFDELDNLKID